MIVNIRVIVISDHIGVVELKPVKVLIIKAVVPHAGCNGLWRIYLSGPGEYIPEQDYAFFQVLAVAGLIVQVP